MSQDERHVMITERCFDPVHLEERAMTITERCFDPTHLNERAMTIIGRVLDDPMSFMERTVVIAEDRNFTEPAHIIGQTFTFITLTITDIQFSVLTDRIMTMFTTSEVAICQIVGAVYDPEEMIWEVWYQNFVEHGPSHSHVKTGLTERTLYAIRIAASKSGAPWWVYSPSETGYYVVQTGPNGGLQFIVP